jgi:hypothetical protein
MTMSYKSRARSCKTFNWNRIFEYFYHTHVYNCSINIRIFKNLFYWIITLDLDSVLINSVKNIYAVKNTLFCPIKLFKFGHFLSMCLYQTGRVRGHGYEVSRLLVSTISRLPFRTVPTAMVFFFFFLGVLILFLFSFFCFHGITFCSWVLRVSIFCDVLRLDVVIVLFPLLFFDTRGSESIKRTLRGQSAYSIPSTNLFYIQRQCIYMYILFILYCQTGRKSLKIQKGNRNPKSKKNRQHNVQKKKDKHRSTKHTHKTNDRITWTPLKQGVNSCAPEA